MDMDMDLYRRYVVTGSLPAVVNAYARSGDLPQQDGDRLPDLRTMQERRGQKPDQPHRGQIHQELPSPISLRKFRDAYTKRVSTEYILHPKPLSTDGDRVCLPLYMSHLL